MRAGVGPFSKPISNILGSDKQPTLETLHQSGEVLADRVIVGAKSIAQSLERDATLLRGDLGI